MTSTTKIVFFGSSAYSVLVAEALHSTLGLVAVVTLPDRIGNRNKLTVNPVKQFAQEKNILCLTPEQYDNTTIEQLTNLTPDFFVVADYGKILPETVLTIPSKAPLNVHHALLPKYRGSSPAPTAILNGDSVSGVTIIRMSKQMDAGDILAQQEYTLLPNETTASLLTTLNILGGNLVVTVIQTFDTIKPIVQDEAKASYTKKMKKDDGHIMLENPPDSLILGRMIRAYHPWPGVWTNTRIKDKEVRIKFLPNQMVQLEGKNPMSYKDFSNGYSEGASILNQLKLL